MIKHKHHGISGITTAAKTTLLTFATHFLYQRQVYRPCVVHLLISFLTLKTLKYYETCDIILLRALRASWFVVFVFLSVCLAVSCFFAFF